MLKEKIYCKICNKNIKSSSGLGKHISNTHKMSSQEYYEKYLMAHGENKCKTCGKLTNFRSFGIGFSKFCSPKCANLNEDINNKKIKTNIINTGYSHNSLNPRNKEKVKFTCLEKYGTEHFSKSIEIKNKIKKTCLEKYGEEHSFQSKNNKIKSKIKCLEKYGVDNFSKTKEFKDNISKINKEIKLNFFKKNILPEGYEIVEYNTGSLVKLKCQHNHIFEC